MKAKTQNELIARNRSDRPALVWVISIWYFIFYGFALLGPIWFLSSVSPFDEELKSGLRKIFSYGILDSFLDKGEYTVILVGAFLLLRLQKQSFTFLVVALLINLIHFLYDGFTYGWIWQAPPDFSTYWLESWITAILVINVTVIYYTRRLTSRGVLK